MNWKKIKTLVLNVLGISAIADNTLTAEQQETIKEVYGQKVLDKFKAGLASENPEEHTEAVQAAMREFFAPEATQTAEQITEELNSVIAERNRLQEENARQRQDIATLMTEPEGEPEPTSQLPESISENPIVMRVNHQTSHYSRAATYLQHGVTPSAEGTIDVADLREEFGTYLSQNRTNLDIIRQIFNGFTSAKHFRTVPAVTEYRAMQSMINSVVQQFKPKWTPQGATKFTPLVIKNYRHKINVPIIPAEVLDSYIFYLYDESLSPDQMPITKYIVNQLLLPRILDDIELRMIFKGKYVESTTDEATSPEESMDGIETLLVEQKEKSDSKVNFFEETINWDTASDEDVVKFMNAFSDFVDDKLKIKIIYASRKVRRRYQRAYDAVYKGTLGKVGGLNPSAIVDYGEKEIVALDGMDGSPIIFASTPGNMVKLRHKNQAPNVINDVQRYDYMVKLFGEFWLGAGFAIAEAVFAYVPEGYDPQEAIEPESPNEFPDGTSQSYYDKEEGSEGNGSESDGGGMP